MQKHGEKSHHILRQQMNQILIGSQGLKLNTGPINRAGHSGKKFSTMNINPVKKYVERRLTNVFQTGGRGRWQAIYFNISDRAWLTSP